MMLILHYIVYLLYIMYACKVYSLLPFISWLFIFVHKRVGWVEIVRYMTNYVIGRRDGRSEKAITRSPISCTLLLIDKIELSFTIVLFCNIHTMFIPSYGTGLLNVQRGRGRKSQVLTEIDSAGLYKLG